MTALELTVEQRDALIRVLERATNELHTELSRTYDRQWKEDLRKERKILSDLLDTLKLDRDGGLGGLTPSDLARSLQSK